MEQALSEQEVMVTTVVCKSVAVEVPLVYAEEAPKAGAAAADNKTPDENFILYICID